MQFIMYNYALDSMNNKQCAALDSMNNKLCAALDSIVKVIV